MKVFKSYFKNNKGQNAGKLVGTILGIFIAVVVAVNLVDPIGTTAADLKHENKTNLSGSDATLVDLVLTLFILGIVVVAAGLAIKSNQ